MIEVRSISFAAGAGASLFLSGFFVAAAPGSAAGCWAAGGTGGVDVDRAHRRANRAAECCRAGPGRRWTDRPGPGASPPGPTVRSAQAS